MGVNDTQYKKNTGMTVIGGRDTYLYWHSSMVPRNVDMKLNVTTSPAGVLSGNSGRQNVTQEWTSARLKLPVNLSVLNGLDNREHYEILDRLPVLSKAIQK